MGRNGVSVRFRLFCLGPAWETDTGDRFRPLKAEFDALDKGLEPSVDYERNQANEHIHAIDAYRLIGKSVRRSNEHAAKLADHSCQEISEWHRIGRGSEKMVDGPHAESVPRL